MKKLFRKYSPNFISQNIDQINIDEYSFKTKGFLLIILLSMSILFMIIFGIAAFYHGLNSLFTINLVIAFIYFILLILLRQNYNLLDIAYIYAFILGLQFLYLIYTGGISGNGYVWTLLFPLGLTFFFGTLKGLIGSIIFLTFVIIILLSQSYYSVYGLEFQLRYIGIYSAITVISLTYERIKENLDLKLFAKTKDLESKLTILKEKDAQLLIEKERAERADNIKSEFLAQMSHEIRTPVNTILNYNWLIKEELGNGITEEIKDSFNSIDKASKRLIRTIDMILNISSIESGKFKPNYEYVMISSDILSTLCKEFKQSAKIKNIDLNFIIAEGKETPIYIDKYSFSQAVANLIDNAIKYTEKGSINIESRYFDEKCEIKISDTGIGISEEYLPRLFHKFTQESEGYSRNYEGNGLGLALVKDYCTINNANISVESKKNMGTTFTIAINLNGSKYDHYTI